MDTQLALMHDHLAFAAALGILIARHLWVNRPGAKSTDTLAFRSEWVKRMFRQPGLEVLAVQTLRNSIMAATVMASTSAIGLMGIISLGRVGASSEAAAARGAPWIHVLQVQFVLPLALLAACVVLFSSASRLYHRCGYLVGLGSASAIPAAEEGAIQELTRAALLYRHGRRVFLAAVATGAWLVSGWLALLTTIVLVLIDIAAKAE